MALDFTDEELFHLLRNIDGAMFAGQYDVDLTSDLVKLLIEACKRNFDFEGLEDLQHCCRLLDLYGLSLVEWLNKYTYPVESVLLDSMIEYLLRVDI